MIRLKHPLAAFAVPVAMLAMVVSVGTVVATASASSSSAVALHRVGLARTSAGVDLRLAVRGKTGRLVISVALRRVGTKTIRHQKHVFLRLRGRRTVTFHLTGLERGASYTYTARAVGRTLKATPVRGAFKVSVEGILIPTWSGVKPPAIAATPSVAGPGAVTVGADLGVNTAKLHGTVTPNGASTQAWFEWDDSTAVDHSTPHRAFAATAGASALQDSISGLVTGRTYYYRTVSTNANGTSRGAMKSFVAVGATTVPPVVVPPTPPPAGPVYYVTPSGSDSADGSSAHPWKTLAKAAASTPAGATAIVAAGTYSGFTMSRSGTASAPITIQAASANSVHVRPASGGSTIIVNGVHYVTFNGLSVEASTGTNNAGVEILDGSSFITVANGSLVNNHSYGIDVNGSTNVTISANTITGNDTGIRINRAGAGVLIQGNNVVNNTGMVVNDPAPGTDWGAVGISFLHTVGPLIARGNTIHGNRAPSDDYGYDGGAFEIYGSSGVTMTSNTIWDNEDVLETGTDGVACANNVFTRNLAWGGNNKSLVSPRGPQANGILLRCGQGMLIANNVFQDLDYWVYDIETRGGFAGSIAGFRILNNVSYQLAHKVYAIVTALPSDAVIDYNVSWSAVAGAPFASIPSGNVANIASFRSLTGQEMHGVFANPLFVNLSAADFHLAPGSPAINAGTPIAGVTDGYLGSAPDAGPYETG